MDSDCGSGKRIDIALGHWVLSLYDDDEVDEDNGRSGQYFTQERLTKLTQPPFCTKDVKVPITLLKSDPAFHF